MLLVLNSPLLLNLLKIAEKIQLSTSPGFVKLFLHGQLFTKSPHVYKHEYIALANFGFFPLCLFALRKNVVVQDIKRNQ